MAQTAEGHVSIQLEKAGRLILLPIGVIAAVVLVAALVLGVAAALGDQDANPEPAAGAEGPLELRVSSAEATSQLPPYSDYEYGGHNVADGALSTAWVVGAGVEPTGETVKVEFAAPALVSELEVANGYQKDSTTYDRNGRVRYLLLTFSDGTSSSVELEDRQGWQLVDLADTRTASVDIKIVEIFPGSDRTLSSAALSELRFLGDRSG